MGQEKLDVSVYAIRGLLDLADMAASKGDRATLRWARDKADDLQRRFEQTWWNGSTHEVLRRLAVRPGQRPTVPAAIGSG